MFTTSGWLAGCWVWSVSDIGLAFPG
jgi:hypothetical protein